MAGTDFSHLTNDELINGIQALKLPDYIRSKAYGVDVRETLAQMTEMTMQLGFNMGLAPDDALKMVKKLQDIDVQLAQTNHEATRKRQLEDLSAEVLSAIEGGEGTSFNLLSIPQDSSVTRFKLDDELTNYMGIIDSNNLFEGKTNAGIIDGETGERKWGITGFSSIERLRFEPNKPIYTNWLSLVPNIEEQIAYFYTENGDYVGSVSSNSDKLIPPPNAVFMIQNMSADSITKFNIDVERYIVTQKISEYRTDIKNTQEDLSKIRETLSNLDIQVNLKNAIRVFDFVSPSLTDSEVIDKALEFSKPFKERVLLFDGKDWRIDKAVSLPSHTTVIADGVLIKQNNGVFDNVFRGDNLELDPENPYHYPLSISPVEHIYIYGINGAKIEGPDVNKKGVHPTLGEQDMVGDFWGWRTLQINLSKCEHFEISGFDFEKTRSWAMSFDKCSHFKIHDINVTSNVKNGDGVDVRFGCHDFEVYDITGSTSDDSVAINTIDYFPSGSYVYPMEPSAFENDELPNDELNIYNGYVGGVHTTGNHHGVIVLANSGRKVYDILINNIKEPTQSTRESVVKIYSGYGSGYNANDISDIRVNDILSKGATHAVQVTQKVDNVWINKVVQEYESGSVSSIAYEEGVTLTNVN